MGSRVRECEFDLRKTSPRIRGPYLCNCMFTTNMFKHVVGFSDSVRFTGVLPSSDYDIKMSLTCRVPA